MQSAQSAEFHVNPVRIYIDGKAKSASLVVNNSSDQAVTIQATINSWTQDKGDDRIVPTDDLVISPPIFKIQPKSKQVVRIGFLKKADAVMEGTYRLYLQEVPEPGKSDEQGMGITLRVSLPVFIAPTSGKPRADLKWKAEPADGSIKLSFANTGNAHVQVSAISINLPDGSPLASIPAMMIYILPGQAHTWDIKTEKPWKNEALRVMIKSDMAAPGVETEVKPES
ncbi:MAG: hypothetical protein A2342_08385 [Gallionellales bacterium RIFOXYB12_FULL_54_9]|nr:MAG: hypothetical protein A2342_08385 [Gallionellales bacterium RIFOXYB12_FULL_54_9]